MNDFGDPEFVRVSKRDKIFDWIKKHKGTFAVIIIALFSGPVFSLLITDYYYNLPAENIEKSSYFEPEFMTRLSIPFYNLQKSNAVKLDVKNIEGVVPNSGWVTINVEDFYEKQFSSKFEATQITNLRIPIGPGSFKVKDQSMIIKVDVDLADESLLTNPEVSRFGPLGEIIFRVEYIDSVTNFTKTYFQKATVDAKINDESNKDYIFVKTTDHQDKIIHEITEVTGTEVLFSLITIYHINATMPIEYGMVPYPETITYPENGSSVIIIP